MERLDKVLSNIGALSRSECKKVVKQGLICVNGVVCKAPDVKINPDVDEITYRGEKLDTASLVYYVLNKPAGYITAKEDRSQSTVFDLIEDKRIDLAAVGRLDKDTTGLLLITNDGALNHYLLSPKHHVEKTYEVYVEGLLSNQDIKIIEDGVDIGDDTPTLPARVDNIYEVDKTETAGLMINCETLDKKVQHISLTITEGRYHQVKRMLAAVGHPVIKLHRSAFGPLKLEDDLSEGKIRRLNKEEIDSLRKERY